MNATSNTQKPARQLARQLAAPAVSLIVLVGMIVAEVSTGFRVTPEVNAYFQRVKSEIEAIPYNTGPWLGRDIAVTPSAIEMLQPNKLMQRHYTNTETGEWFQVLVVHCGDVRDMIGHYPPVCYPNQGWSLESNSEFALDVGTITADAASYSFTRKQDVVSDALIVANIFALPASDELSFGPELAIIERAGRFRDRARLGAAQVQVITPPELPEHRRDEVRDVAFELLREVLVEVERGPA